MSDQFCQVSRWHRLKTQLTNLPYHQFQQAIEATPAALVIDVRTPAEFATYHLPGAINLDYLAPAFWDEIEQLDPHGHYFIYCRSCRRSTRACTLMRNGGFAHVYNLDGGLAAWPEAERPAQEVAS